MVVSVSDLSITQVGTALILITVDPSQSGTYASESNLGAFKIEYFDHSKTSGYYITDTVTVDDATTVTGVTLAVATSASDRSYGILGIGMDGLESGSVKYPGLLDDLYNQGAISCRSYSIYLDDLQSSTGSILFGAADSSKYSGSLVSLPIVPSSDNLARLSVDWTYMSITNGSGASTTLTQSSYTYPVVLDTGYTQSVLPVDIYNALATAFGVTNDGSVTCDMPEGFFTFGFGEGPAVSIEVPFSELAVPDGSGTCLFGFAPSDQSVISFGDTFLRSAYVYYDYDAMTISLAQSA
jgi:hypothetical protein